MGKHELPPLRMIVEKGRLVPASPYDQERLDGYQNGARLQVSLWQGRNAKLSRKYWAILHKVVADLPCPWQTAEEASDALKLACGITDAGKTVNDQWFIRPGSISFSTMPEDKFRDFFERAMAVLARVTGVDPTTLGQEAADVGDEDENSDDSTLSSQAVSDDAGETPSSPAELDGDGESSSPSSPSEEEPEPEGIDRKWLVTVWKTLRAAVGEDPGVVERQTVVFAESAKAKNKATRDKAQAVKRSLMRVCEGADLDEEIKYAAGIIGVDREELVGGADASS